MQQSREGSPAALHAAWTGATTAAGDNGAAAHQKLVGARPRTSESGAGRGRPSLDLAEDISFMSLSDDGDSTRTGGAPTPSSSGLTHEVCVCVLWGTPDQGCACGLVRRSGAATREPGWLAERLRVSSGVLLRHVRWSQPEIGAPTGVGAHAPRSPPPPAPSIPYPLHPDPLHAQGRTPSPSHIPRGAQGVVSLGREFDRKTALFDDDATFIAEVARGEAEAPGMDAEAELATLTLRYRKWKSGFKQRLAAAEKALRAASGRRSRRTFGPFGR